MREITDQFRVHGICVATVPVNRKIKIYLKEILVFFFLPINYNSRSADNWGRWSVPDKAQLKQNRECAADTVFRLWPRLEREIGDQKRCGGVAGRWGRWWRGDEELDVWGWRSVVGRCHTH